MGDLPASLQRARQQATRGRRSATDEWRGGFASLTEGVPFYDEASGALRGLYEGGREVAAGRPNRAAAAYQRGYRQQTGEDRAALQDWRERRPLASNFATGVGLAAPAPALAAGAPLAAPNVARGLLRRSAASGASGAGAGYAYGAGAQNGSLADRMRAGNETAAVGGALGAVAPAAISLAGRAIPRRAPQRSAPASARASASTERPRGAQRAPDAGARGAGQTVTERNALPDGGSAGVIPAAVTRREPVSLVVTAGGEIIELPPGGHAEWLRGRGSSSSAVGDVVSAHGAMVSGDAGELTIMAPRDISARQRDAISRLMAKRGDARLSLYGPGEYSTRTHYEGDSAQRFLAREAPNAGPALPMDEASRSRFAAFDPAKRNSPNLLDITSDPMLDPMVNRSAPRMGGRINEDRYQFGRPQLGVAGAPGAAPAPTDAFGRPIQARRPPVDFDLPDKPLAAVDAPPRSGSPPRPRMKLSNMSDASRLPYEGRTRAPGLALRAARFGTEANVDPKLIMWGGVGAAGPVGMSTAMALEAWRPWEQQFQREKIQTDRMQSMNDELRRRVRELR